MSTLSLRIPDYLHENLRVLAQRQGVSINQLITLAVAEKLAALMTEDYLAERAARGSREKFEAVLAKVKDAPPEPYDAGRRPSRKVYHVMPGPQGKGWRVAFEGARRASSAHDTKAQAIEAARKYADSFAHSEIVIHDSEGSGDEFTYDS